MNFHKNFDRLIENFYHKLETKIRYLGINAVFFYTNAIFEAAGFDLKTQVRFQGILLVYQSLALIGSKVTLVTGDRYAPTKKY